MFVSFLRKKIAASDYLLAAEIVDAVNEKIAPVVKSSTSVMQNTVLDSKKELFQQLDMVKQSIENGFLYSVENMSQIAASGQYSQVEKKFEKIAGGNISRTSVLSRLWIYIRWKYFEEYASFRGSTTKISCAIEF